MMIEIWKPQPSKLNGLRIDNPNYWALCVSRSQYSEDEVLEALAECEQVNFEWQRLQAYAYEFLQDNNGEMNTLTGFSSDEHKKLFEMLNEAYGYIQPSYSQNSHVNCFPVQKWQKEVAKVRREISKIEKFIKEL